MLLLRISLIALNRIIKLSYENKEILDSQKNRTIFSFSFFLLSPSIKRARHARHKLKIHVKEFLEE